MDGGGARDEGRSGECNGCVGDEFGRGEIFQLRVPGFLK